MLKIFIVAWYVNFQAKQTVDKSVSVGLGAELLVIRYSCGGKSIVASIKQSCSVVIGDFPFGYKTLLSQRTVLASQYIALAARSDKFGGEVVLQGPTI